MAGTDTPPHPNSSRNSTQRLMPPIGSYTLLSTYKVNKDEGLGAMKWELDLWYELWDRSGSQGLDTWYELRGEVRDRPAAGRTPDVEGSDDFQDRPSEGA